MVIFKTNKFDLQNYLKNNTKLRNIFYSLFAVFIFLCTIVLVFGNYLDEYDLKSDFFSFIFAINMILLFVQVGFGIAYYYTKDKYQRFNIKINSKWDRYNSKIIIDNNFNFIIKDDKKTIDILKLYSYTFDMYYIDIKVDCKINGVVNNNHIVRISIFIDNLDILLKYIDLHINVFNSSTYNNKALEYIINNNIKDQNNIFIDFLIKTKLFVSIDLFNESIEYDNIVLDKDLDAVVKVHNSNNIYLYTDQDKNIEDNKYMVLLGIDTILDLISLTSRDDIFTSKNYNIIINPNSDNIILNNDQLDIIKELILSGPGGLLWQ